MDKATAEKLLRDAPYKFAKTMANIPHSYTLKENDYWDKKTFVEVVKYLNQNGVKEKFFTKYYTYYYANGYKYWTMYSNYDNEVLINRAK